ncbi:MAG: DsbA family protein [Gemmatimonadaceae bacterium]
MANNNPPRNARSASKTGSGRSTTNSRANPSGARTGFYALLIAIAVIGAGVIFYLMTNPATGQANGQGSSQYDSLKANYAKAGPPQPYVLGNATAPVVIEEFADYECPVCGSYAAVTEPDVRKNIIQPGLASYKYYDFPLPQHKNSQAASNAAACADEQGKFWPMHDQLFAGQDAWGLQSDGGTQVTDNPKPIFLGYAKAVGLNTDQWEKCFDGRKYQARINANTAEVFRRNLNETPTFFVNGKMMQPGSVSYDALKKAVDAAAAAPKPASAQ